MQQFVNSCISLKELNEDKKELNYSPHVPKDNRHPHYLSHGHTRVSTLVIFSKS